MEQDSSNEEVKPSPSTVVDEAYLGVSAAHSPLPWRQARHTRTLICAGPRVVVEVLPNVPAAQLQANAEFIALACNAHDDLVSALRGADEFIARFYSSLPTGDLKGDYWRANLEAIRSRNINALALAGDK